MFRQGFLMQHMSLLKRFAVVLLSTASSAMSAEIQVLQIDRDDFLVSVNGEIELGDEESFRLATRTLRNAAILLDSPGGNLHAGLEIGKEIWRRGFATGVAPGSVCASACGLAWLGGSKRFMSPSSLIGFHAAYVREGETLRETGTGNALVGAYLNRLGLSDETIVFVTASPPESISWLTVVDIIRLGIPVSVLPEDGTQPTTAKTSINNAHLKLPSGFRWIVVRSGTTLSPSDIEEFFIVESILGEGTVKVVTTRNGMSAIALGPFIEQDAKSAMMTLISGAFIPFDSYLSSGNGFIAELEK